MKLIKNMAKYAGLMVFGFLMALLLLEGLVRLAGAKPVTYLRKFSQYHPALGWEKSPFAEGYFRRGDAKIHEKMNSRGLRDREYEYDKAVNVFRILVLGDSFTEGYDVNIDDIFTEILERRLNDSLSRPSGRTFEVINAGTGGYSTDQEYLFYSLEGKKYDPDLVILMVYAANDIYYTIRDKYGNYSKPLFELRQDSLILTNVPLPKPLVHETYKNWLRETALYPMVTQIILQRLPSLARLLRHFGVISQSTLEVAIKDDGSKSQYPPSFSVYQVEYDSLTLKAWATTEALLASLAGETRNAGSSLLICSIPDRFQIYDDDWKLTQEQFHVDTLSWDPAKPDRVLQDIANKLGVPFLSMTPALRHSEKPLYNGVHWNENGNVEAAAVIYDAITSRFELAK